MDLITMGILFGSTHKPTLLQSWGVPKNYRYYYWTNFHLSVLTIYELTSFFIQTQLDAKSITCPYWTWLIFYVNRIHYVQFQSVQSHLVCSLVIHLCYCKIFSFLYISNNIHHFGYKDYHNDNLMFFWPCIMNWLYVNYQLDTLIIIYS